MIFIESGKRDERSFDSRILFATSLRRAGFPVAIDDETIPDNLHRNQVFEAQSLLCTRGDVDVQGVIVIGAQDMPDEVLRTMRVYNLGPTRPIVAMDRFTTQQGRIGAQSKIAYATGVEPTIIDLADLQKSPLMEKSMAPLLSGPASFAGRQDRVRVSVFLPGEMVEEDPELPLALSGLNGTWGISVAVITTAKGKSLIGAANNSATRVFAYAELSPFTFAAHTDIVVVMGANSPGERIGQLSSEVLGAGGVVVDCTRSFRLSRGQAPVIQGTPLLRQLPAFLEHEILSRIGAIRSEVAASAWCRSNRLSVLTDEFPQEFRPAARPEAGQSERKTVFVPTNGVGLGHAQRCSQIAAKMDEQDRVVFAAFPSCIELVRNGGFASVPLVQKSASHEAAYANDIVNYRRLKRALSEGDRLVFDGVYIFDSIYRTIMENRLDAVWIRRGLWRSHQTNEASLEREHCFDRVIVPLEAFDELNRHYSFGSHIRHVGPILQIDKSSGSEIRKTRDSLAKRLGRRFDKLVISMLGGGVAADRGPQLQMLCAALEARKDCLHLIVVWPNATIAPELTLWNNTRVVRTLNALRICQAADFVISAVGYNSFHEIIYHGIPAIFLPQTASYMDDQERRAKAAADRGLAEMVLPEDLLVMERKLGAFLDGARPEEIRSRLVETRFPEPGNIAAAQAIQGELRGETRRLA